MTPAIIWVIMTIIFGRGSVDGWIDPNTIVEKGNPTSTAGILAIIRLCEILNREVRMDKAREHYQRGWGPEAAD